MRSSVKRALIIASITIVLGIILAFVGISMMGRNFIDIVTDDYTPVIYGISDDFASISIETDTHDINFALSENSECRVVCDETAKVTHTVTIEENTLVIKTLNNKKWYDYISIFTKDHTITVYLPQNEYDTLTIKTDTGKIEIPKDFSFTSAKIETDTGDIKWQAKVSETLSIQGHTCDIEVSNVSPVTAYIKASTGNIQLSNIKTAEDFVLTASTGNVRMTDCETKEKLLIKTSTGNVSLESAIAGELNIQTSTGDVTLKSSDAENIYIETSTGDVKGTVRSEKIFLATTDTGKVNVPSSTTGGICQITTSTGDIKISIN